MADNCSQLTYFKCYEQRHSNIELCQVHPYLWSAGYLWKRQLSQIQLKQVGSSWEQLTDWYLKLLGLNYLLASLMHFNRLFLKKNNIFSVIWRGAASIHQWLPYNYQRSVLYGDVCPTALWLLKSLHALFFAIWIDSRCSCIKY